MIIYFGAYIMRKFLFELPKAQLEVKWINAIGKKSFLREDKKILIIPFTDKETEKDKFCLQIAKSSFRLWACLLLR